MGLHFVDILLNRFGGFQALHSLVHLDPLHNLKPGFRKISYLPCRTLPVDQATHRKVSGNQVANAGNYLVQRGF